MKMTQPISPHFKRMIRELTETMGAEMQAEESLMVVLVVVTEIAKRLNIQVTYITYDYHLSTEPFK
jgi:hypothetical protein